MSNALDAFSEILPVTNLSELVANSHDFESSPYDDSSLYRQMFEQIVRAFYRQSARHVILISERGISNSAILTELARRGLRNLHAALVERTILLLNARNVPPEISRQVLHSAINEILEYPDLIVGIEGFAKLLFGAHGSNKNRLIGILPQVRCNLIGFLTPREYQELIADDAEIQEHFTRIEVLEPDLPLAMKQLSNFGRGFLQLMFSWRLQLKCLCRACSRDAASLTGRCRCQ
jgi:ATP-dependent Clp protease ATP-binding subunit ClpA